MENKAIYKRVLLKLSGEALSVGGTGVLNFEIVDKICKAIKELSDSGTQVALVVGAGNIWRGRSSGKMDKTRADHMGMLATTINAIALQDALCNLGKKARVFTAVDISRFAEPYSRDEVVSALEAGEVVVFGCGLGSPFFSTDTAAVLRAIEINADAALFAKNIDGVYSDDPNVNPDAVKYDVLTYEEILRNNLRAIDLTAAALSLDNNLNIVVFKLDKPEDILRAASGETVGTLLKRGNDK